MTSHGRDGPPEEVVVTQVPSIVSIPPDQRSPMALAAEWVSRITTVALEMVLPGIFGNWLDGQWRTGFLALVGFALGLTVGMWHLIRMTKTSSGNDDHGSNERSE